MNRYREHVFMVPVSEKMLSQILAAQKSSGKQDSLMERYARLDTWYKMELEKMCFTRVPHRFRYVLVYLEEMRYKKGGLRKSAKELNHILVVVRRVKDKQKSTEETGQDYPFDNWSMTPFDPQDDIKLVEPGQSPSRSRFDTRPRRLVERRGSIERIRGRSPAPPPGDFYIAPFDQKDDTDDIVPRQRRRSYERNNHQVVRTESPTRFLTYNRRRLDPDGDTWDSDTWDSDTFERDTRHSNWGTTEIPKEEVDIRAVKGLGYNFKEERGHIVIDKALTRDQINYLREKSMIIRERDDTISSKKYKPGGQAVQASQVTSNSYERMRKDGHTYPYRTRTETREYYRPDNSRLAQPGPGGFVVPKPTHLSPYEEAAAKAYLPTNLFDRYGSRPAGDTFSTAGFRRGPPSLSDTDSLPEATIKVADKPEPPEAMIEKQLALYMLEENSAAAAEQADRASHQDMQGDPGVDITAPDVDFEGAPNEGDADLEDDGASLRGSYLSGTGFTDSYVEGRSRNSSPHQSNEHLTVDDEDVEQDVGEEAEGETAEQIVDAGEPNGMREEDAGVAGQETVDGEHPVAEEAGLAGHEGLAEETDVEEEEFEEAAEERQNVDERGLEEEFEHHEEERKAAEGSLEQEEEVQGEHEQPKTRWWFW
jgi:hypothetical protein